MAKILYLDPARLSNEDVAQPARPDPRVGRAVRRAVGRLTGTQREIIAARFNEGLTFEQIGARVGLGARVIQAENRAAMRALKGHLAPFVASRWHIEVDGLCRICGHPQRGAIEELLRAKDQRETWGSFGRRLERAIGERIHPPRILIVHMGHMGDADGSHTQ